MSEFIVTKAMKTVIENTVIPKLEEEVKELRKYKEYYNNFITSEAYYYCKKCLRYADSYSNIQYNCHACLKNLRIKMCITDEMIVGCSICSPDLVTILQKCHICNMSVCNAHKGNFCQFCHTSLVST